MGAEYNGGAGAAGAAHGGGPGASGTAHEGGAGAAGAALAARLAGGPPLLLDGATGTELERRGVASELPLWSARALLEAPETLLAVHRDYVAAGAEALVANTFRTQRRTLARAGVGEASATLTDRAVSIARRAAGTAPDGRRVFVLGSAPPLEDCYRPGDVPEDDALAREHAEHAAALRRAGVDAVAVETMNTIREARAAAAAAREAGLPFVASFVCGADARLLSGEPLEEALETLDALDPLALGVNCVPPAVADACLPTLGHGRRPVWLKANLGAPRRDGPGRTEELGPEAFAERARAWVRAGAAAVGGCCGTTPAHVAALRAILGAA